MEKVIKIDGHNIGIYRSEMGKEVVRYDGVEVSSKFSMTGATHIFTVNEDGDPVIFEVVFKSPWVSCSVSIKKNGKLVHAMREENLIGYIILIICAAIIAIIGYLLVERADIQERFRIEVEKIVRLPEMPIDVTYREAYMGDGLVAQFTNTSGKHLSVVVALHNTSIDYDKSYRLDLAPWETKELGHFEGWAFASGDTISVLSSQYKTKNVRMP